MSRVSISSHSSSNEARITSLLASPRIVMPMALRRHILCRRKLDYVFAPFQLCMSDNYLACPCLNLQLDLEQNCTLTASAPPHLARPGGIFRCKDQGVRCQNLQNQLTSMHVIYRIFFRCFRGINTFQFVLCMTDKIRLSDKACDSQTMPSSTCIRSIRCVIVRIIARFATAVAVAKIYGKYKATMHP